jgi:hypothetical protein
VVHFTPAACPSWYGTFEPSGRGSLFPTMLTATPDPGRACILANGDGYIVPVCAPSGWEPIPVDGILSVCRPPGSDRLLVWGGRDMAMFDRQGLAWVIEVLSLTDLEVSECTESEVRGTSWNPTDNGRIPFVVQLASGEHQGGWDWASVTRRGQAGGQPHPRW